MSSLAPLVAVCLASLGVASAMPGALGSVAPLLACSPILLTLLATQVQHASANAPAPPRPSCQIPYHARRDAFDQSFDLGQCEERGYCWYPAPRGSNIPWCYHPLELEGYPSVEECAAGAAGERRDCAPSGRLASGGAIDAFSCSEEKRCCWAPGEAGQPWCFYAAGQGYADAAEDIPDEDDEL